MKGMIYMKKISKRNDFWQWLTLVLIMGVLWIAATLNLFL